MLDDHHWWEKNFRCPVSFCAWARLSNCLKQRRCIRELLGFWLRHSPATFNSIMHLLIECVQASNRMQGYELSITSHIESYYWARASWNMHQPFVLRPQSGSTVLAVTPQIISSHRIPFVVAFAKTNWPSNGRSSFRGTSSIIKLVKNSHEVQIETRQAGSRCG